jgi:hypothetical protein
MSIDFRRNLTLSDRPTHRLSPTCFHRKSREALPMLDLPGPSDIDDLRRQNS